MSFGGAHARILGGTATQLTVMVPVQAANGDIVVGNLAGTSDGFAFTVGVSTPPVPYFTQPDDAFFDDSLGAGIFLNRTIVGFGYDIIPSTVTTKLNAAEALDSFRTGWSIVGELPELNAYQVEWTFSGTPTTGDMESLLDDIHAQGGVIFVDAEQEGTLAELAVPSDFDLYYGSGNGRALAQINFEEARRLYWLSGLSAPSQVDIYVPDTGLIFGSVSWGGFEELPDDRFALYERSGSGWTPTAADGHYTYAGHPHDHGTSIAGLIGARSQRDPDWRAGAARPYDNASGILSSFELFDVDDDGIGGVDDPGEWGPASITVFNVVGSDTDSEGYLSDCQMLDGVGAMAAMPRDNPGVTSVSLQFPPSPFSYAAYKWPHRLAEACRARPIIQAAGNNEMTGGADVDGANILASSVPLVCPGRQLVVGGTQAGSADADEWDEYAHYGDEVGILAPMTGWFVATTQADSSGTFTPTYHAFDGTSAGTPAVASAYALLRGIIPESTLGDAAVLALLVSTGDDVSARYSKSGSTIRLNLFEAVWEAIRIAGGQPAMTLPPQVFVADYYNEEIVTQDVDPETGELLGTAYSIDTTLDDCYGPTDVVVHPLGDVVYALCVDSSNIVAWTTDTWTAIGALDLEGVVATYSEMTIAQDGILRVGTIDGGNAVVESFDTWIGSSFMDPEIISTSATGRGYGADVNPADGLTYAFGVTDNSATEDDDALVILVPDRLVRTVGSSITAETFSSFSNTMLLRDVSWFSDGSDVVGEFYGTSTSGSDKELAFTDGSSTATATIDDCEQPVGIVMDPLEGSGIGWVACTGNYSVVEVDLSSAASSYTPSTTLYMKASSGASYSSYPVFVEAAQNGAFIVVGSYSSTLAAKAYVISRDDATAGGSVYNGSYDAVGASFERPRGVAITPMLSIASPRPGIQVGGIKRFHVIVRDPSVTAVVYQVNGTPVCTDYELWDGSSEDCLIDTSESEWDPGDNIVTVTAIGGTHGDFSIGATYSTWL